MFEAIKYNFANLLNFRGRENRPTFWWYVLFLVILDFVLGLAISGPMVVGTVSTAINAAQGGASPEAMQAQIANQVGAQMGSMIWVGGAVKLAIAALALAAFVRRVHDSDNSGWWAAVPLVVQVASFAFAVSMMGRIKDLVVAAASSTNLEMVAHQQAVMARYGMIGWISPLVIVVFGLLASTEGPNRYGNPQPPL